MEENTALTPIEVAEKLKIAKNTVYELIKRGELRGYRVGKKVRVDLADVEAYKLSTQSKSKAPETSPLPGDYVQSVPPQRDLTAQTAESIARISAPNSSGLAAVPTPVSGTFVLAGQDMILDILAQRVESHPRGIRMYRSYQGSYNGLYALYQGSVNAATAHLWDGRTGVYNRPFLPFLLPGIPLTVIHLAKRMVGFYVMGGNPRALKNWDDLARSDLMLANRERGSGMRVLLDERLRLINRPGSGIQGYEREFSTHLAVASAVARGGADFGLGNE
jgi:putative molybdopterin biosynthesis protein